MARRTEAHVVIVGGGFAGLEALVALRALAGERVRATLVSPAAKYAYRPAAPVEAFGVARDTLDVQAIAANVGARYCQSRIEAVASQPKWVRLASGVKLEYDALVLAIGARPTAGIPGALTFRDQRDVVLFRRVLDDVRGGRTRRLVFSLPAGHAWLLPVYELALLSAAHSAREGTEIEITIVSPEPEPLAAFGPQASALVGELLAHHGVRFLGSSFTTSVERAGSVRLADGRMLEADRVVAVPELRGRPVTGVPADWRGFAPTDAFGAVLDLKDVYAAGDMTAFPIKQGGVATHQADQIAHAIAQAVGAPVRELRAGMVLRALLVSGERPLFLRTELDAHGHPIAATFEHRPRSGDATSKVFARYLAPYLEQHIDIAKVGTR